jgi:Tfp pilus assembly PilM family ATPase
MVEAVEHAKKNEFEKAVTVLGPLVALTDYRFKQTAADAAKAIDKIMAIRERTTEAVERATKHALDAFERGDHRAIVRHLSSVPANLLSEKSRRLLARAETLTEQWNTLDKDLRTAIANKDWCYVGRLLQQLLELEPNNEQYQKLASQVAAKLTALSRKMLDEGDYEAAVIDLDAIPAIAINDGIKKLGDSVQNIYWLSRQFDQEPYVSPTLGKLAVRLAKETPNDPRTRKLVQQLAQQLKQAPRAPRMHLPAWKGSAKSWLGGEVGLAGLPLTIEYEGQSEIQAYAGRFNIAFGLALQGLGKSRIAEDFYFKRKGLLSIGRRRGKTCWGLDIGTSAVKGVLLQEGENGPAVVDTFFHEFEVPIARHRTDIDVRGTVQPAIEKFLEKLDGKEVPVWANMASSLTVNRFVRLPPVKDKEANTLLTQEVVNKVPIPIDELVVVRWIHDAKRQSVLGRPAIACTSRRSQVMQRIELIEACGLKLAGLQSDAIALVNFASHEFADLWRTDDPVSEDDPDAFQNLMSKAIAFVDCGASATNVLLVSGEAHWSWTVDVGGQDFTNNLARSAKTVQEEAEKLKRNPAALKSPANEYQGVETRLDELRSRLSMVFADGLNQDNPFTSIESWCSGGGSQTHQWIRRVMLGGERLE